LRFFSTELLQIQTPMRYTISLKDIPKIYHTKAVYAKFAGPRSGQIIISLAKSE